MNASVQVVGVSESIHADFDFLRREIRKCFRVEMPTRDASVGAFRNIRGDEKLNRPSSTYTVIGKDEAGNDIEFERVKPAHDQWATTTHATATQRPGFSRECITERDYSNSKYAQAIGRLQTRHIQIIHANYHSDRTVRDQARSKLSGYFAAKHKKDEVRSKAKLIALLILKGRASEGQLQYALGMNLSTWRASYARKMYQQLSTKIRHLDETALLAWDDACVSLECTQ